MAGPKQPIWQAKRVWTPPLASDTHTLWEEQDSKPTGEPSSSAGR